MQDLCSQSGLQTDLRWKNLFYFDLFWLFQFGSFDCLNRFKSILEFAGDASSCEGVSIGIFTKSTSWFHHGLKLCPTLLGSHGHPRSRGKREGLPRVYDDILDDFWILVRVPRFHLLRIGTWGYHLFGSFMSELDTLEVAFDVFRCNDRM